MTIPVISDIINGIKWSIDFFVDKVPNSIKFLIFLILLMAFGSFFSIILQMSGIHCDSNKEVHKTNFLDFFDNYKIMKSKGSIINYSSYQPDIYLGGYLNCLGIYCEPPIGDYYEGVDDFYYLYGSEKCEGQNPIYMLSRKGANVLGFDFGCLKCDTYISSATVLTLGGSYKIHSRCLSDAYELPINEKNIYQKTACNSFACTPPKGYYWESDTGNFDCYDNNTCGINITEQNVQEIDVLLDESNSNKLYVGINENDYRKAVLITCDEQLTPIFTFYGIPIFNYEFWVLIMLMYVLIMLLFRLKASN